MLLDLIIMESDDSSDSGSDFEGFTQAEIDLAAANAPNTDDSSDAVSEN